MKIFIPTPNKDSIFSADLIEKLEIFGEVKFFTNPDELSNLKELFEGSEERILALDPDFCNWKPDAETIAKIPNLQAVCLQTTSFSWIDTEYLKTKNIPVVNLRGFSMEAVAEWATIMALSLARKIPLVIKGGYNLDIKKYQGVELAGKTTGIIGLGRNGKRTAELMKGLGMNVIAWDLNPSSDVKMVSIPEIFSQADVIFPMVADNEETRKIITDDLLRSMKPSAIFISVIHFIYNHKLVLDLVREGKLYGYGFESEKPDFMDYVGNVWAGPQLAWATDGSMRKNGEQWVEAITNASKGEFPTRVN